MSKVLISIAVSFLFGVHSDSNCVVLSMIRFRRKSMSRSYFRMKSAPIIGDVTSATTNGQKNSRRSPKFNFTICSPITLIGDPFAANNNVFVGRRSYVGVDSGSTDTSAPVSMRKFLFVMESCTCKRNIERSFAIDVSLAPIA